MRLDIAAAPKLDKIDHLFVLLTEKSAGAEISSSIADLVRDAADGSGFGGRTDETITILTTTPRKTTLIGIGKRDALTLRAIRTGLHGAAKIAKRHRDRHVAVHVPYLLNGLDSAATTRVLAGFLSQADYKYDAYITVKKDEKRPSIQAVLVPHPSLDAKTAKSIKTEAHALADGIRTVRDLANGPGNLVTPSFLAARAEEVAKAAGIKATVYGKREIERMKMGGLLAVNRGSHEEPRFIVLEYTPRKKARGHVALVGKGITFDSGGISIKPSEKMEEMKFDMCGAAAVIGTMQTAAALALPVKITGIIPSTENLPGGSAYKPGDIITMMNGKTVEIVNTDAEGRMILGDALHYASELKPDHLIDYATLTGACVVALGSEATGLFSNNDELAQKLIECGERAGERLWRLPEWDDYKDLIRSEWADMKNSGGRWGGAVTAAVFLKQYVTCGSWAHLDIAGTAYMEHETPREARGATGAGVRVSIEFLRSL